MSAQWSCRRIWVALVVLLGLLAAACGDGASKGGEGLDWQLSAPFMSDDDAGLTALFAVDDALLVAGADSSGAVTVYESQDFGENWDAAKLEFDHASVRGGVAFDETAVLFGASGFDAAIWNRGGSSGEWAEIVLPSAGADSTLAHAAIPFNTGLVVVGTASFDGRVVPVCWQADSLVGPWAATRMPLEPDLSGAATSAAADDNTLVVGGSRGPSDGEPGSGRLQATIWAGDGGCFSLRSAEVDGVGASSSYVVDVLHTAGGFRAYGVGESPSQSDLVDPDTMAWIPDGELSLWSGTRIDAPGSQVVTRAVANGAGVLVFGYTQDDSSDDRVLATWSDTGGALEDTAPPFVLRGGHVIVEAFAQLGSSEAILGRYSEWDEVAADYVFRDWLAVGR